MRHRPAAALPSGKGVRSVARDMGSGVRIKLVLPPGLTALGVQIVMFAEPAPAICVAVFFLGLYGATGAAVMLLVGSTL